MTDFIDISNMQLQPQCFFSNADTKDLGRGESTRISTLGDRLTLANREIKELQKEIRKLKTSIRRQEQGMLGDCNSNKTELTQGCQVMMSNDLSSPALQKFIMRATFDPAVFNYIKMPKSSIMTGI